jgi:predicted dehydrogenase
MTLRFGVVGAGNIAQVYLRLFDDLIDAAIVGVADFRPDVAAAAATRAGATPYATVEDLLDAEAPDAIVVCTPPDTHPDIALAAIERRVAVLCEKPLATRIGPAQTMMAAAQDTGVPLTMATKFRFVDDIVRAQELVAAGALGELIQIENRFASRIDMRARWNSDPAVSGGGVLIDNGTHSVDIARSFLGPIHEVLVVEGPKIQNLEVEDSVQVLLRAASGATATIDLSWSYDHATDAYLELYGSAGVLRVGWHSSELRANDAVAWTRFGGGYDKITCMRAQVSNFCAALRGEEPMRITDADAIASVQVIDACYRSLTLGDWTPVELVQRIARAGEDVA